MWVVFECSILWTTLYDHHMMSNLFIALMQGKDILAILCIGSTFGFILFEWALLNGNKCFLHQNKEAQYKKSFLLRDEVNIWQKTGLFHSRSLGMGRVLSTPIHIFIYSFFLPCNILGPDPHCSIFFIFLASIHPTIRIKNWIALQKVNNHCMSRTSGMKKNLIISIGID